MNKETEQALKEQKKEFARIIEIMKKAIKESAHLTLPSVSEGSTKLLNILLKEIEKI